MRWRPIAATGLVAGLTACGSSFGSNPTSLPPAPSLPVAANFAQSRVVTPAASSSGGIVTVPLPPSAGYAGTAALSLPQIPTGLQLTVTYRNTPPAGLAPLAATRRPAASRFTREVLSTDVVYACVAANMAVSVGGTPRFTFTLPALFADPRVRYFAAVRQDSQWIDGYGGPAAPATVNGSAQVTINGRYGFALATDVPVCVALYGRWSSAPTPAPAVPPARPTPAPSAIPSPSVTPTASPTGAPRSTPTPAPTPAPTPGMPTASRTSLSFAALGSAYAQTFSMTESAYSGTWSQSDTCAGRTTVTTADNVSFSVTPNAVGACTITMSDSLGATTAIAVDITSSTIGVQ